MIRTHLGFIALVPDGQSQHVNNGLVPGVVIERHNVHIRHRIAVESHVPYGFSVGREQTILYVMHLLRQHVAVGDCNQVQFVDASILAVKIGCINGDFA